MKKNPCLLYNIEKFGRKNLECQVFIFAQYISVIFETCKPPKGSKGKKGKGKVLVPLVLEPVNSEPDQEEVDKTTNVNPKKKKIVTAFT